MQSRRLNSLSIEGFRAFKSLRIERFADVNLIVGKNNSGKTTLLEALRLYFLQGDRYRITELLLSREEYSFQKQGNLSESGLPPLAYEALFYGRPKFLETKPSFRIGPLAPNADNAVLDVDFTWLREVQEEDGTIRFLSLIPT